MGFLDKIKFWRKSEDEFSELGLGEGFGEPGRGPTPGMPGAATPGMPEFGAEKTGWETPETQAPGGQPPSPAPGAGTPYGTVQAVPPPSLQPQPRSADTEIVIAKLDAIKAHLDSINQRLANLERTVRENEKRW